MSINVFETFYRLVLTNIVENSQRDNLSLLTTSYLLRIFKKSLLYMPIKSLRGIVQFSHSVLSDSLRSRGPEHTRPPSPSPTPGVYWNSSLLSQWCHPTISFSVVPFSSCPQSFPASGSFQMSQLFTSGGQNIGVSASPSVLPMNLRMDWLDLLAVILKQIWRPHIVSLRNTSKINNFVQDIWT